MGAVMLDFTPMLPNWRNGAARLAVPLLVALLAAAGGAYGGYRYAKASGDARLQTVLAAHATAQAHAEQQAAQRLTEQVRRGNALARQQQRTLAQLARVQKQLQRNIPHVTTVYQSAPGAALQPLPRTVFTRGAVRLFNQSFGSVDPCPERAATGNADTASATEAGTDSGLCRDALADSHVSQADLAQWLVDLGQQCQSEREQLIRLIELVEGTP